MLPLFFIVVIKFGIMGYAGIPLDAGTILIASILIGVGVDYSIHFLGRVISEMKTGCNIHEASLIATRAAGYAIIINAVTLIFLNNYSRYTRMGEKKKINKDFCADDETFSLCVLLFKVGKKAMVILGGSTLSIKEDLPKQIIEALGDKGIDPQVIEFSMASDLTLNGEFGETWLLATKEKIYIVREESDNFVIEEVLFTDIERIRPENMIGSAMIVIGKGEDDRILVCYTSALARKFSIAVKVLEKLRKGEEVNEEDLLDKDFERNCPKCGTLYPNLNRKVCPKCLDRRSIFRRVLSFVPRYRSQIILILLCMLASSAMKLLGPFLSGRILFDEVLTEGGKYEGQVGKIVLIIFGSQLLSLLISIAYGRINAVMTAHVIFDLKSQVFGAMQRLSLSFFTNKETGWMMTRVNSDSNQLQRFFNNGFPYFIVNIVNLIGIAFILFSMDWFLTLLILLPAPLVIYIVRKIYPRLWSIFSRQFRRNSALNSLINDSLTGVRVVKAFGKEDIEVARFEKRNDDLFDISMEAGHMSSTIFPLVSFLMGLGALIIWAVGGWQVINETMTFGTLITFVGYMGLFYGPIEFMTHIVDWWSSCMNAAQRIFEILDSEPDVIEAPDAVSMSSLNGEVEIKDMTFGYEKTKPVLYDINLHVKPGEMIGLVGHSGAGKSTMINLIARLYDVDSGSISIDGVDVRKISMKDLRSQIGIVLQETYLFNGSIAENIAYARPDCKRDDIIRAAKVANAHDFIMKLPDGYDTVIGRRGMNLSGGERQRLAIARAILHDPKILILDEATASVDTETERQIQEALERLVKGRTTFAIAHRLSTLRNADRLFVLEKGKNVELGTHEELLKAKGTYFNLIKIQREGMKIKGIEG